MGARGGGQGLFPIQIFIREKLRSKKQKYPLFQNYFYYKKVFVHLESRYQCIIRNK